MQQIPCAWTKQWHCILKLTALLRDLNIFWGGLCRKEFEKYCTKKTVPLFNRHLTHAVASLMAKEMMPVGTINENNRPKVSVMWDDLSYLRTYARLTRFVYFIYWIDRISVWSFSNCCTFFRFWIYCKGILSSRESLKSDIRRKKTWYLCHDILISADK